WTPENLLMRVGIQGRDIPVSDWKGSNIVLLIDVSGSMNGDDRLGLLKHGFKKMVESFNPGDRIAIVTYAGNSGVHLESTDVSDAEDIIKSINKLGAGGSTNGADGIITAYEIAQQHFIPGGNNRVILGTDGDFNVGITDQDELVALIEEKRDEGVFLTTVGVGNGNYQDNQLEQIANHGNGTYEYIYNETQAEKVFVNEFKKLLTVAKDVKVQVHFDPNQVQAYRLIGYENRLLDNDDFLDDTEDAGEIGADQNITALYELIPASTAQEGAPSFTIDFRYKDPDADNSEPLELIVPYAVSSFEEASENHRFVAAVAAYGMLLRDSEYAGSATYNQVMAWAQAADDFDPFNYREAFKQLIMATINL
ncbi:MAG: YfbK domain-containing protein, partial [Bacteroidota bacterium]